jgi:ketosteroid isomerase-like protein
LEWFSNQRAFTARVQGGFFFRKVSRWEKINSADEENTMNPEEVFMLFVTAINRHDMQALRALMAPDHIFIDSLGRRVEGAAPMEAGWRGYFAMCADYWIRTENVMAEGSTVLAVGEAGGSIDGAAWQTPAAWKAEIRAGTVTEWRVFADNKPVYEILARR